MKFRDGIGILRLNVLLFFLLLSVCIAPTSSKAEDSLTFALFARGWPPFEMVDDGVPHGMAVDLFHELIPDNVVKDVVPMTRPRAVLHAERKPIYTRLEVKKWIDDPSRYWWSEPVMFLTNVLYSPALKPLVFKDASSLEGLTLGCIRNYFYPVAQPLFDSGKAKRYDVNSDVVLLRMVKAGRVDAAIFDAVSAEWLIKKNPDLQPEDFHVAKTPVDSVPLRFVFNHLPEWEKRLPAINERIRQKREDGTIERLKAKYR